MKKIIGVILIICFLITGCGKEQVKENNFKDGNKGEVASNVKSKDEDLKTQNFSFGPKVNQDEVSQETKNQLQGYLDKLGNPEKDNISFNGFSAKFRQDGALVLSVFIRNGYNYTVYNIDAKVDIKKNGEVIATATFKLSRDEFGELNAGESRVWNLVYEPAHILNKTADLEEYILEYSTGYNRK